jgi:hypothetical protein
MRLKALDIAIVLAAAALVAFSAVWVYAPGRGRPSVVIDGRGGEWVYPLSEDREIAVPGPLGNTIIRIKGKTVRVEDSPCPNKTCIAAGPIERANQWLACLPNEVFVRIEGGGGKDEGVDASVY